MEMHTERYNRGMGFLIRWMILYNVRIIILGEEEEWCVLVDLGIGEGMPLDSSSLSMTGSWKERFSGSGTSSESSIFSSRLEDWVSKELLCTLILAVRQRRCDSVEVFSRKDMKMPPLLVAPSLPTEFFLRASSSSIISESLESRWVSCMMIRSASESVGVMMSSKKESNLLM